MGILCQVLEENMYYSISFPRIQQISYTFIYSQTRFSLLRGNLYRKFKFLQNFGMSLFKINSIKSRNVERM